MIEPLVDSRDAIPLIYILGTGHSGSTLLDLMLGSHSLIESVGEARTFDDYFAPTGGMPLDQRGCTCGVPIDQCLYWKRVRERLENDSESECRATGVSVDKSSTRDFSFFRAVRAESGKPFLCDSSKDLQRLRTLLIDRRFQCRVLHLIRDGRAVAYSFERLARAGNPDQSPWEGFRAALVGWEIMNLRISREFGSDPHTLLVHYETLADNPAREMTRIQEWLGLKFESPQLRFWENTHHNLCGNRMRMLPSQSIQRDTRYLSELSPADWEAGSAIVAPTLRHFGYSVDRH